MFVWGFSEETFFTLSHALYTHASYIKCMLTEKKFKHVLPGRSNNVPIEKRFPLIRHLGGCFAALDVTACGQAERTLLLRLVSEACRNNDGSHSKYCFNFFVEEVNALTKISETVSTKKFTQDYGNMIRLDYDLKNKILRDKILPFIVGHGLKKHLEKNHIMCPEFK